MYDIWDFNKRPYTKKGQAVIKPSFRNCFLFFLYCRGQLRLTNDDGDDELVPPPSTFPAYDEAKEYRRACLSVGT